MGNRTTTTRASSYYHSNSSGDAFRTELRCTSSTFKAWECSSQFRIFFAFFYQFSFPFHSEFLLPRFIIFFFLQIKFQIFFFSPLTWFFLFSVNIPLDLRLKSQVKSPFIASICALISSCAFVFDTPAFAVSFDFSDSPFWSATQSELISSNWEEFGKNWIGSVESTVFVGNTVACFAQNCSIVPIFCCAIRFNSFKSFVVFYWFPLFVEPSFAIWFWFRWISIYVCVIQF